MVPWARFRLGAAGKFPNKGLMLLSPLLLPLLRMVDLGLLLRWFGCHIFFLPDPGNLAGGYRLLGSVQV